MVSNKKIVKRCNANTSDDSDDSIDIESTLIQQMASINAQLNKKPTVLEKLTENALPIAVAIVSFYVYVHLELGALKEKIFYMNEISSRIANKLDSLEVKINELDKRVRYLEVDIRAARKTTPTPQNNDR